MRGFKIGDVTQSPCSPQNSNFLQRYDHAESDAYSLEYVRVTSCGEGCLRRVVAVAVSPVVEHSCVVFPEARGDFVLELAHNSAVLLR